MFLLPEYGNFAKLALTSVILVCTVVSNVWAAVSDVASVHAAAPAAYVGLLNIFFAPTIIWLLYYHPFS